MNVLQGHPFDVISAISVLQQFGILEKHSLAFDRSAPSLEDFFSVCS